jgi:hypothetical protein
MSNHPDMYDVNGKLVKHGLCLAKGCSFVVTIDGIKYNIAEVLTGCKNIGMITAGDGSVHVSQEVADAVWGFMSSGGYGGLELGEFLDKIFSGTNNGIYSTPC